jgi:hypothetical protein
MHPATTDVARDHPRPTRSQWPQAAQAVPGGGAGGLENEEMKLHALLLFLAAIHSTLDVSAIYIDNIKYHPESSECLIVGGTISRLRGGGERSGPDMLSRRRLVKGRRRTTAEQQNAGFYVGGIPGSEQQQAMPNLQNSGQQPSFASNPFVQPNFGFGGGSTASATPIFGDGSRPLGFASPSFPSPLAANPFAPPYNNPAAAGQPAQQQSAPQAVAASTNPFNVASTNPFNLPLPHTQTASAQQNSFQPLAGFGTANNSAGGFSFGTSPFGGAAATQGARLAEMPDHQ